MLLTSCLLFLTVSSLAESDCGELGSGFFPSHSKRAIIGGNDIKAEDVPWIVRIYAEGHICTGTLINDRQVVTAAHCFTDVKTCKKRFHPQLDFHICHQENTNNKECSNDRTFPIKSVHFLDDYLSSGCMPPLDIVVVDLERSVPSASTICLPRLSHELNYEKTNKSEAHLIGYSENLDMRTIWDKANTLLQHGTRKISLETWETPYFIKKFLTAPYDTEEASICAGDSGGPMFEIHDNKAVLIGVNVIAYGWCLTNQIYSHFEEPKQYSVEVKQHLERIAKIARFLCDMIRDIYSSDPTEMYPLYRKALFPSRSEPHDADPNGSKMCFHYGEQNQKIERSNKAEAKRRYGHEKYKL